jgi:CubicO group peptidase (beta-lactamase class C family)
MTPRVTAAAAVATAALATLLTACSGSAGSPGPSATASPSAAETTPVAPTWERAAPASAGFAPARLREVTREARRKRSSCYAVVRDGQVVVEDYWRGGSAEQAKQAFSVTKSVVSTLVGMAQDRGLLSIDQRASRYIAEWRGTPSATVTIRNLLANDSGREWSTDTDYGGLLQATDQTAYAVGLSQTSRPGEVWAYNNAAIQTLDRVLREATGRTPSELAEEWLFEPLGMTHSTMSGDRSGNSTGTFSGLQSTCLDLARFGMLFAQQGRWDGEQLVSKAWVRAAVGASSQELNAGYGLLWWVNRAGDLRGPVNQTDLGAPPGVVAVGRLVPDGPADMFAALGFGGQVVAVDPGSQTVVVRMGDPVLGDDAASYTFADAARAVTYATR